MEAQEQPIFTFLDNFMFVSFATQIAVVATTMIEPSVA
jgi:hypothetical protein